MTEQTGDQDSTRLARLLVVDDHPTDRLKLTMSLKRLGYQAQAVSSGEEALALIRQEDFDLVFLDLLMPGMDGLGVLAAVREARGAGAPPIVVVSSVDEREVIEEALTLGAREHLPKTFAADVLEGCLARNLTPAKG